MKIQYQILFSVEVLHHYFSSQKWKDVLFVPLPETGKLIREKGLQLRQVQNQLLVITPIDESGMPPSLPEFFEKFSFILLPQALNFSNFTNLPYVNPADGCFLFNNLRSSSSGTSTYITEPILPYDPATVYNPGAYVKGNDGKIYESIKVNIGAQAPDETEASGNFWSLQGFEQFVNIGDTQVLDSGEKVSLRCTGPTFNFRSSVKKMTHEVNVYQYDFSTTAFDSLVLTEKFTSNEPFDFMQLHLGNLSSGVYKVQTGSDVSYVYLLTAFQPDGVPFLIEIHHLHPSDSRSLLKEDYRLKNSHFSIRFGTRRVYWKYKTRTNAIKRIEDSSGDFTFKADGLRKFISEKPIPLSDAPRRTFSANTGSVVISSPLPNPRVDRLLDKKDEIYTTETFINF